MALKMSIQRFKVFKAQDQENGLFDVTFEIEGKFIYAHKFILASVSAPFKTMFSSSWNKDETIKIETNSYIDFYEFLSFLYSGICELNDENIFPMVDLAEFYQVKALQQRCDKFLYRKNYTKENVMEFFKSLSLYFDSLPLFEKAILPKLKQYYPDFVESENVLSGPKEFIRKIVSFEDRLASEEKLFEMIIKWAENRIVAKEKESKIENFNLNDAIKTEITPLLPYIKFKEMSLAFLIKNVVKNGFLLSYNELSDILDSGNPYVKVKVTNSNGQTISGYIPYDSMAVEAIKSLKNSLSNNNYVGSHTKVYWGIRGIQFKNYPIMLKKRDDIEWYLYYSAGCIGLSKRICIHDKNDKILAEMIPDASGFYATEKCKIEIE